MPYASGMRSPSPMAHQLSGSQPCGGLGQRHPTTTPRDLPPGAPFFRKTSSVGTNQASPGSRPVRKQTLVTTTSNPSLLND